MTLLEFARGPGMQWAMILFAIGIAWRIAGVVLLLGRKDRSEPRGLHPVAGGLTAVVKRSLPPHELEKRIMFQHLVGYAWHLGFFITLLFFAPHLVFLKSLLGFGWPALANIYVLVIGSITLALLVILLLRRAANPVLRVISTPDDYLSTLLVILPLATGFLAYGHLGARYELLLALHLLSVQLLMVWFPFGKLMHLFLALPTRYVTGSALQRKGVEPS